MAYGIEIFNSSGVKVLELSNRVAHFVVTGSITIGAGSTSSVTVPGMQNNDTWLVIVADSSSSVAISIYTVTKSTNSFSIYNQMGVTITYNYWVLKA